MPVTARRLAALAAPVLLAGTLSSCGAVGGPPTDASVEDFCAAQTGLFEALFSGVEPGGEPDGQATYDALQDAADEQAETGTPEDMPEDARNGFEIQLDALQGVDEDEFIEAFESEDSDSLDDLEGDLSDDEEADVEAFNTYSTEQCGNPAEDLMGDMMEDQLETP